MVVVINKGATKEEIQQAFSKLKAKKGVDTNLYCGTVKFNEDALVIQKRMRDEWQ